MATLDERSQHIIRARWLDDESKTTCRSWPIPTASRPSGCASLRKTR